MTLPYLRSYVENLQDSATLPMAALRKNEMRTKGGWGCAECTLRKTCWAGEERKQSTEVATLLGGVVGELQGREPV